MDRFGLHIILLGQPISTSQRCSQNKYLGNKLKHVKVGKIMLYRNLLSLTMHQYVGGIPLLEQPLERCMPSTPMFRSTWKFLQWNYAGVWLGAYGAESKQTIKVFSPVPRIEHLVKTVGQIKTLKELVCDG